MLKLLGFDKRRHTDKTSHPLSMTPGQEVPLTLVCTHPINFLRLNSTHCTYKDHTHNKQKDTQRSFL